MSKISQQELNQLHQRSDGRAWFVLFINWLMIFAALAASWQWLHPLVVLVSLIILGNRQLGLAIIMHDCAHNAFFKSKNLNQWAGKWLCAAPVFADLDGYRRYHLEHHRSAGSSKDPDRSNYAPYPVSRASLARKIGRDLFAITGLKTLLIVWKMNAGLIAYQLSYEQRSLGNNQPWHASLLKGVKNLFPTLVFFVLFSIVCLVLGSFFPMLVWLLGFLTCYMLFSRIRNAAEHAVTPDINDLNPIKSTRTTLTSWLGRLTVAPNFVNYHLEHHLYPQVPPYHLPKLHQKLREAGELDQAEVVRGYLKVIQKLTLVE